MRVLLISRLLRGGGVKMVNNTSWMDIVTLTGRPKSVRNRCLIDVFVLSLGLLDISISVGGFVIGMCQTYSPFSVCMIHCSAVCYAKVSVTVVKIFPFCNLRLLCYPRISTNLIEMKSTMAYTKPISCINLLIQLFGWEEKESIWLSPMTKAPTPTEKFKK